jgi:hypothetical protein
LTAVLCPVAVSGCGGDDPAVEVRRARALEEPAIEQPAADEPAPDEPATGEPAPDEPDPGDPLPGLTAAARELIASSPSFSSDTCPLFSDPTEVMAPYGPVTSQSSGTETDVIRGAPVAVLFCNIGTEGGLGSFRLGVAEIDATDLLAETIAASPDASSGTVTPVAIEPFGVLPGTFAAVCIEGAAVSDQCRYAWSSGHVHLVFNDLVEIDPVAATSMLETALAVLQLSIF